MYIEDIDFVSFISIAVKINRHAFIKRKLVPKPLNIWFYFLLNFKAVNLELLYSQLTALYTSLMTFKAIFT